MKVKKVLYIILGTLGLVLGAIGAILPLIPTFPFLMLATICYAKSSDKLHNWFIHTKLYKSHLESYVKGEGMSRKVKIRIMIMVTILMSIGFLGMAVQGIYHGCIVLVIIWILHIFYLRFRVKTIQS